MNQTRTKKRLHILISLLAIGVVLALGYEGFGWKNNSQNKDFNKILNSFNNVSLSPKEEAWQVFQNYLEFARIHNLSGIRSISHQISPTCNDPSKEKECFTLMDNVYNIASSFELKTFTHIETDEKQAVLYTDGPLVTIIFFTKIDGLKVLGMRFCVDDPKSSKPCVETDPVLRDQNNNGWWDDVESLFY